MKTIKVGIYLLVAFFVVACSADEGALFDNSKGAAAVSFPSKQYEAELSQKDGEMITVTLQRAEAESALDVEVGYASTSSLFEMPDSVFHFAKGEYIASQKIVFPGSSELGIGNVYEIKLTLKDKTLLSSGGIDIQEFKFSRQLTWKNIGKGVWTDGFLAPVFNLLALTYKVDLQQAEEDAGVYRMVNPYGVGVYEYTEDVDVVTDPCYVLINASDPDRVLLPRAGLGIDYSYGEIFVDQFAPGKLTGKRIVFEAEALAVGMKNFSGGALAFYAEECILVLP